MAELASREGPWLLPVTPKGTESEVPGLYTL